MLAELMPAEPEVLGLLALMELQASRAAARADADGNLVLLADQDRARWEPARIARPCRAWPRRGRSSARGRTSCRRRSPPVTRARRVGRDGLAAHRGTLRDARRGRALAGRGAESRGRHRHGRGTGGRAGRARSDRRRGAARLSSAAIGARRLPAPTRPARGGGRRVPCRAAVGGQHAASARFSPRDWRSAKPPTEREDASC